MGVADHADEFAAVGALGVELERLGLELVRMIHCWRPMPRSRGRCCWVPSLATVLGAHRGAGDAVKTIQPGSFQP